MHYLYFRCIQHILRLSKQVELTMLKITQCRSNYNSHHTVCFWTHCTVSRKSQHQGECGRIWKMPRLPHLHYCLIKPCRLHTFQAALAHVCSAAYGVDLPALIHVVKCLLCVFIFLNPFTSTQRLHVGIWRWKSRGHVSILSTTASWSLWKWGAG